MSIHRKQVISWCLYDFANSTYSAVIAAVVFPVYYASQIVGNDSGMGDLWWGRAISLSMLIVALSSPLLGGIADFMGLRKRFLFAFTALCICSVSMFAFLEKGMVIEGFLFVVFANIGMEGAMVFYNSFLPHIVEREYQGRVSSWGFGVGYAGSVLALLVSLPLVTRGYFDFTWLMVAMFFTVFSIPAFIFLPSDAKRERMKDAADKSIRYTMDTLRRILREREARKFLLAYLIYADGVSTVVVFSSLFAATTLGFATDELVGLYIVVQITALMGAFAMARKVDYWGPKRVVSLSLCLWSGVCIFAYFISEKNFFWILATIAGTGLGTVQSASRAFFAQFIPRGHESEYFGVYSLVGKSSAVLGPLLFGYVSSAWGSQRPAILSVTIFFLTGLVIVRLVRGGGPNVGEKGAGHSAGVPL